MSEPKNLLGAHEMRRQARDDMRTALEILLDHPRRGNTERDSAYYVNEVKRALKRIIPRDRTQG